MKSIPADLLWKGYIEDCCDDVLNYFYEDWMSANVDWSAGITFLDKEFQGLFPDSASAHGVVDKLAKVMLNDGAEQWVLFHIEVQGYRDPHFPERMFRYFYRIRERYGHDVVAIALLTHPEASHLPDYYSYKLLDTELRYQYRTLRLTQMSEAELDRPGNPFSIVLLAAKAAADKRLRLDEAQFEWKTQLMRRLLAANYSKKRIKSIFNFISFVVCFNAKAQDKAFRQHIFDTFKSTEPMGLDEIVAAHIRAEQVEKVAKLEALLEEERLAARREVETIRREAENARREAELAKALDLALRLHEEGLPLAKIARLTGLSEEQVKAQIG